MDNSQNVRKDVKFVIQVIPQNAYFALLDTSRMVIIARNVVQNVLHALRKLPALLVSGMPIIRVMEHARSVKEIVDNAILQT